MAPAERNEADRIAAAELRAIEARAQAAMLVEAVEDRAHEVGPRTEAQRHAQRGWGGTPETFLCPCGSGCAVLSFSSLWSL